MESNELTIVIVTFKSEKKIFSCLDSIPSNIGTIVVENSNNKLFKKEIENKYPNVKCILLGKNEGYSKGNNVGLKEVQTKFALVLNPDTRLEKNSIANFFIRAKEIKNFWLMGPGNDQSIKKINQNKILEVKNLKGFAIFFNLSKFNNNFFDENFFLYFEEIDLCKRVIKNGGKIFLDSSIKINHDGASSADDLNKDELEKNRNWHWMWSTFYFHKKYKGFLIALLLIIPNLFSSIFKTILYQVIFNKKKRDIYFCRTSGIINSILGKNSWYRPPIN